MNEEAVNPDSQPVAGSENVSQAAQPVSSDLLDDLKAQAAQHESQAGVTVTQVEEKTHHDDTDVEAALSRDTQDGRGEGDLPDSDFHSYATEDVEKEDNS